MLKRTAVAAAAVGLAVALLAPTTPASAFFDVCGWTGNVSPLLAEANKQVASLNLARMVRKEFGAKATPASVSPIEVSLLAPDPDTTPATSARDLIDNTVDYRVVVRTPGADDQSASLQLLYRGLCFRTAELRPMPRVGSLGVENPALSAQRALRLAQEFRMGHADRFPLENPLVGLDLMRATSAPPDFGKLRWFVTYQSAPGVEQVLAVYMNGRVKVVVP